MNGAEERKERFVVVQVGEKKFSVLSLDSTSGKPKQYCVQYNSYRWLCNCPHFLKHCEDVNFVCKHIQAVMTKIGEVVEVRKPQSKNNGHEEEKPLLIEKKVRLFWNE